VNIWVAIVLYLSVCDDGPTRSAHNVTLASSCCSKDRPAPPLPTVFPSEHLLAAAAGLRRRSFADKAGGVIRPAFVTPT